MKIISSQRIIASEDISHHLYWPQGQLELQTLNYRVDSEELRGMNHIKSIWLIYNPEGRSGYHLSTVSLWVYSLSH